MAPAIGPTIALAMLPFDTRIPPSFNIPISNVPGRGKDVLQRRARREDLSGLHRLRRYGAQHHRVLYAEQMGVGYVADREVVGDIETLIPLTDRALAELERVLA